MQNSAVLLAATLSSPLDAGCCWLTFFCLAAAGYF
jgi:hypothetical protein